MAQITYVNKEYLYENGDIPAKNKVQDTDMNEIKSVVNSNETKELLAVTDTAPAQCSTGDKYFNTSTKKIYTATGTNTWGTTGVNPTRNTIYLEFATQTAYAYDGTTLVSVGGGSQGGGDSTPIGTVEAYSGNTAPNGYLLCDGSAVSRTTYSDLFSVIGTTYGSGDGSTTFNLPNLKGRTVVMQDTTQTEFDTLGETGGSKTDNLSNVWAEIGYYENRILMNTQDGATNVNRDMTCSNGTGISTQIGNHTKVSGSVNKLQPYIVLNYIIKANKISEVPTTAEVQNTYSTSQTDTYSCDYINKLNTYSTTEQKVGTWIDGKSIYRKVIEANNVSLSSSGVNIPSGITNVGVVTKLDINMKFTDNSWFSFWHLTDIKLANNNDITLYTDSSSTATFPKIYIIIEYTKTTD